MEATHLGPPNLRGKNKGTLFDVVYFSRGTQNSKKGVKKGTWLGHLDMQAQTLANCREAGKLHFISS